MNLILLEEQDFISENRARLSDRRFRHILEVHRANTGDELRVGRVNGLMGSGQVISINQNSVDLEVSLDTKSPEPLPLTLLLALPRPKFLKKTLQTATSLGVKRIYLFNSYRVEKVYWSTQQVSEAEIRESCLLGLEQARDTIMPEVHLKRLFKPFVEDEAPDLIRGTRALIAHPTASEDCPFGLTEPVTLAIGPEGGFIDYEINKFAAAGFQAVRLYPRILKVEAAVATLIGRLMV